MRPSELRLSSTRNVNILLKFLIKSKKNGSLVLMFFSACECIIKVKVYRGAIENSVAIQNFIKQKYI